MSKIGIIIHREYTSRVRKRSFLLATLLTPILFLAVAAVPVLIAIKNERNERVAVVDPQNELQKGLRSSDKITYQFVNDADTGNFGKRGFTTLLLAPHASINASDRYKIISDRALNSNAYDKIESDIGNAVENGMISSRLQVDPARIDSIRKVARAVKVDQLRKEELASGRDRGSFGIQKAIGYASAFFIYITLIIYGMMVMRGVMEEKTNKVAEVMVSSVRPFELMLGKIIGIGAVGLTQFLAWIILATGIALVALNVASHDTLQHVQSVQNSLPQTPQASEAARAAQEISQSLSTVNWGMVLGCFLFYFLGGYLFYAALFAAVGSAVNEDPQDVQSLTMPITMPIILSFIIMAQTVNDPNGPLSTWASIIPFTSPILMMSRIPFAVPFWQLALSMLTLVAGFLGTTWLCARIYRTGILMYGKKPTWKELIKWARK